MNDTLNTSDANSSIEQLENSQRTATVNCAPDGEPLGIALFLNAEELTQLGVDPEATGVVAYSVEDGDLRVDRPRAAEGEHE